MSTIVEIEAAIEQLPTSQVDELARWLQALRANRAASPVEIWLERARGNAVQGITTESVMALTRGDE